MKTTKQNFKTTGLVALLAGGLAVGGIVYNKTSGTPKDDNVKKTETTLSDLSVETIESHITILSDQIEIHKKQLVTKDLNPEERFKIRQTITATKNKIYKLQQELNKRQDENNKTVYFDTLRDSR